MEHAQVISIKKHFTGGRTLIIVKKDNELIPLHGPLKIMDSLRINDYINLKYNKNDNIVYSYEILNKNFIK